MNSHVLTNYHFSASYTVYVSYYDNGQYSMRAGLGALNVSCFAHFMEVLGLCLISAGDPTGDI